VLDECAVITRPGAASRRPEVTAVAEALAPLRPLVLLEEPATLDGGDVLRVGHRIFVGRSGRTNDAGVSQLRDAVAELGYEVISVQVTGCLHLKSAVTAVAPGLLLANTEWLDLAPFGGLRILEVAPEEPSAANALLVGDHVIAASAFPRTIERLRAEGLTVSAIDVSEIAKAEGALTCCSLIVESAPVRRGA